MSSPQHRRSGCWASHFLGSLLLLAVQACTGSSTYMLRGDYRAAVTESTADIDRMEGLKLYSVGERRYAYITRATAYRQLREYDKALGDLRKAVSLQPTKVDRERIDTGPGALLLGEPRNEELWLRSEALARFQYVDLLVFLRRQREAEEYAKEFLDAHPQQVLGQIALALAKDAGGNYHTAYDLSKRALTTLSADPASIHIPVGLDLALTTESGTTAQRRTLSYVQQLHARLAARLGYMDEAWKSLDAAAVNCNDFSTKYSRATVYYIQGDWGAAAQEIDAAYSSASQGVRESGVGLEAQFLLGNCDLRLSKFDDARQAYERFVAANQYEPEAYFNLAQACAKLNMNGDAIDHYSSALRLDPGLLEAYANRGTLYLESRRYEDAVRDFSAVLAKQPKDATMLYKRAYSYCASGNAGLGAKDLRVLLQVDPGNGAAKSLLHQCGRT